MPIKQTIEIVWHTMTERPPRFGRYLVAEANCGLSGRVRLATAHKPLPSHPVVRKSDTAGGMRMQVRDLPAS